MENNDNLTMNSFFMSKKTKLRISPTESQVEIYFDHTTVDIETIINVYDIFKGIKDTMLFTNSISGSIADMQNALFIIERNMKFINKNNNNWKKLFKKDFDNLYNDIVECRNFITNVRQERKDKLLVIETKEVLV